MAWASAALCCGWRCLRPRPGITGAARSTASASAPRCRRAPVGSAMAGRTKVRCASPGAACSSFPAIAPHAQCNPLAVLSRQPLCVFSVGNSMPTLQTLIAFFGVARGSGPDSRARQYFCAAAIGPARLARRHGGGGRPVCRSGGARRPWRWPGGGVCRPAVAFTVLKPCGAAYLAYLAWQALRAPAAVASEVPTGAPTRAPAWGAWWVGGMVMNLTNPRCWCFSWPFCRNLPTRRVGALRCS